MNIIVIDQDQSTVEKTSDYISRMISQPLLSRFESPVEALDYLFKVKFVDIILCDIEKINKTNFKIYKLLRNYCDYLIVFANSKRLLKEAVNMHAFSYLLKPIAFEDLDNTFIDLLEIRKNCSNRYTKKFFFCKGDRKNSFYKILTNEIINVEALANYVSIVTRNKAYITYISLKQIESLKLDNFLRISRSIIVNVRFIDKIEGNTVTLSNMKQYTIGNKYKSEVFKVLYRFSLNIK